MTIEIALLFAILVVMAYFFFTEKLPVELTAFLGLSTLLLGGFVSRDVAFTGFASPVVITMLSIFFLSAALLQTGVADFIGRKARDVLGTNETVIVVAIMLVAGVLSAFMNNIAAAAVLLPAVGSLSRRAGIPPSRLFMPLSFGAILGGTTTLVGTPPNMLAASGLVERGFEPFTLFEFAPLGAVFLVGGVVYMITIGRRLLPAGARGTEPSETRDLVEVYHLEDAFFSIRIPEDSKLDGMSLRESRFGSALGVQVVSIVRSGERRRLAPDPETVLRGGDELQVHGRAEDLERLFRVQGVEIGAVKSVDIARATRALGALAVRVREGSAWIGRSVRDLRLRESFSMLAVGVVRDGAGVSEALGDVALRQGDVLVTLRTADPDSMPAVEPHAEIEVAGRETLEALRGHLFLLRIPEGSELAGTTLGESRMSELMGITVSGIVRDGETQVAVDPAVTFREGDELVVLGETKRIEALLEMGRVELKRTTDDLDIESEEAGIVEATLAPRSPMAEKSIAEVGFRERFGLQVLSIWRDGEALHTGLANLRLRFGDALLLQGSWKKIRELGSHPDFVVLSLRAQQERRVHKAPYAIGALLLMIAFVVTGLQPIHVAAFVAASLVVLSGAITMEEAYRAVEWRAIFLVAAVLPVGVAMENTGAASLLSGLVTQTTEPFGPYAIMAGLFLLASLLSQCLDGAPAVVILTPVAIETARQVGISPYPFMMGIAISASAAFMTPFSHKANLLVMGAGGYRVVDYLRVGTPLTIVLLAVLVFLVPVFFPLTVDETAPDEPRGDTPPGERDDASVGRALPDDARLPRSFFEDRKSNAIAAAFSP